MDGWGVTLRRAHNTTKRDAEDLFLQTLSLWTDNGAGLNGVAWHSRSDPPAAPGNASEIYLQLNWSMVDESSMVTHPPTLSATYSQHMGPSMKKET